MQTIEQAKSIMIIKSNSKEGYVICKGSSNAIKNSLFTELFTVKDKEKALNILNKLANIFDLIPIDHTQKEFTSAH